MLLRTVSLIGPKAQLLRDFGPNLTARLKFESISISLSMAPNRLDQTRSVAVTYIQPTRGSSIFIVVRMEVRRLRDTMLAKGNVGAMHQKSIFRLATRSFRQPRQPQLLVQKNTKTMRTTTRVQTFQAGSTVTLPTHTTNVLVLAFLVRDLG